MVVAMELQLVVQLELSWVGLWAVEMVEWMECWLAEWKVA